jgi:site-specific DNA recombinase
MSDRRRKQGYNGVNREPQTAVIYTRVSDTAEENNEFSHEYQEAACRKKAEALGYRVAEVFRDNFSGRYLYERPGLSQLRDRVRAGGVNAVFIWKFDRVSRKRAQRAVLEYDLDQNHCQTISATEEIPDTIEGKLLEAMLTAIAEFEVERTRERSQASLQLLRDRGAIICQGQAKYGYRYVVEKREREIIEVEAEVVRKIFQWYVGGDSAETIALRLTAMGEPTPSERRKTDLKRDGKAEWNATTIRNILRDASYTGEAMISGRYRIAEELSVNGKRKITRTNPEDWWAANTPTPAIISRELYDQARQLVHSRTGYLKTCNKNRPYLLRGMVRCAVCGRAMCPMSTTNAMGKKYYYFACISAQLRKRCGNKPTPMAWLDPVVWDRVVQWMDDKQAIEQRFQELRQEEDVDVLRRDLAFHQRELVALREAIRRTLQRLESTDDPEMISALEERLAANRANLAVHQDEVVAIEDKLSIYENKAASLERAQAAIAVGRERLRHGITFEEKRQLLEALAVQVIAKKKEITLRLGPELVASEASHRGFSGNHKQRLWFEFSYRPSTETWVDSGAGTTFPGE